MTAGGRVVRGAFVTAALAVAACATAREVEVVHGRMTDGAAAEASVAGIETSRFTAAVFVASDGTSLPYRLLAPPPEHRGRRLPLVLSLHGSGAMGTDNARHVRHLVRSWALPEIAAEFPCWVVAPQVATRSANYTPDTDGLLAAHPGASFPALIELAEHFARRDDVDPARVYVVGVSMGGSTALEAVVARPRLFAAAVSVAGVAPPRGAAAATVGVPQLLLHGTADTENPIEPARAWAAALAAAGGRVRFVEYEGMGHEVPGEMVAGAGWRRWVFGCRR